MFSKTPSKLANKVANLFRYIDGTDIYNAVLLRELPKLQSIGKLEVTSKRYDLLAKKAYDKPEYNWILALYNGILEQDLQIGSEINYPSLVSVVTLIQELDEYC
jgi:hypothetical protein